MSFAQEFEIMVNGLFHLYLLWALWQDIEEMQVVRYSHLLGVFPIVLLGAVKADDISRAFWEYVIYMLVMLVIQLIQYKFACYGLADAVVLFLCGSFFLLEKGRQDCLLLYFMLQAAAGMLFLAWQGVKGNITGLYVKHAVPYIPYIYIAFILTNGVLWKYI